MPTDFDWRIGVLEGKALYACRYFMARKHWQILKRTSGQPDERARRDHRRSTARRAKSSGSPSRRRVRSATASTAST